MMNMSRYHQMARLRLALNNNFLTVTTIEPQLLRAKNLPESITIDLDEDPNTIGPAVDGFRSLMWSGNKDDHWGNQYNDTICEWFSVAVEKEIVLIRAPSKLRLNNEKKRTMYTKEDDLRKGF